MKGTVAILLLLVIAPLLLDQCRGGLTCGDLQTTIGPCATFLDGQQKEPSEACCSGVRMLVSKLKSAEDRRAACECMKEAAGKMPKLKDNINALFDKCRISLPEPINLNMDCDKIQ